MTVEIPDPDERTQELFQLLFSLHDEFPGQWCLIGGYMVYLLALEAELPVRQTTDADVLANPAHGLLRKMDDPVEFPSQLKPSYRRRLAAPALADRSCDAWSYMVADLADQGHTALMLIGQ